MPYLVRRVPTDVLIHATAERTHCETQQLIIDSGPLFFGCSKPWADNCDTSDTPNTAIENSHRPTDPCAWI